MLGAIDNKYIASNIAVQKISNFLYSDFYFLSVVLFIALFWGLGQVVPNGIMSIIGICILLLVISGILILQRDVLPALPLLFMATCIVSVSSLPSGIWVIGIFIGMALLSIAFHLVYYRIVEFKFGKLFFPLVLFGVAILIGGLGSRFETTATGKFAAFALLAMLPLLISLMLLNYADRDISVAEYTAKVAIYFALLIIIELAMYYIINWSYIKENVYNVPHLGWAVSNSVAAILLMTFPMGFYLYTKTSGIKSFIYLFMGIFGYFTIFPTTSRGALLFGSLEFVCTVIATIFVVKDKKRKEYLICCAILFVLGIGMFAIFFNKIIRGINIIFNDGFRDSGRFEIYREAMARFFEYPILGVGFGYKGVDSVLFDATGIYQFHDTLLQMAACLGLVGFVVYCYYYFAKVEIIFENKHPFGLFLIMVYIGYEGYSLINVGTIKGFPDCTWIVALTVILEIETRQQESCIYRKLINKFKNRKGFNMNNKSIAEV